MALKFKRRSKADKTSDEEDKAEKPAKGKAFKAASGARFVLLVGDEGAILVHSKGNVVLNRQFIPDTTEQNLSELRETLLNDPKAPVMLLIDSMDQTFLQQTLPPVSKLSVGKLIKRRLDRDFGANDIKGALLLGREKTGRKDWNFMMISIEKNPALTAWLDFLAEVPNRFKGIYLVSVESENLIRDLDRAMGVPKGGTGSEWKFFVSHNKVGGFRQVILRNGRIVFTRLAQPIGESTPEVTAGNIEQEMLTTIEYMKRLSFNAAAGLDVYIIASSGVKPLIDKKKFETKNFNVLAPYEVAQYLGIEGATQPTDQFGDVILAAVIGGSKKHSLTLTTPQSRQLDKLALVLTAQRGLVALTVLGLIGYAGYDIYDIYTVYEKSDELAGKQALEQKNLDALKTEIKNSNLDIDKTNDMIDLYSQLIEEKTTPFPLIAKISELVKPPISIKSIDWSLDDDKKTGGGGTAPPVPPSLAGIASPLGAPPAAAAAKGAHAKMTAVITFVFAASEKNPEAMPALSRKLLQDFKEAFKGYDINYAASKKETAESDKMDLTLGDTPEAHKSSSNEPLETQMTIKGDVMPDAVAAAAPTTAQSPVSFVPTPPLPKAGN